MPYITPDDLAQAYGEEIILLADRDHDGAADAGVIEAAIRSVDEQIEGHLRSRFALPLIEVPGMIRQCALRIARYLLADDHATDRIKDDYQQALKDLRDIREGRLDVGLTLSGESPAQSGGPIFGGGRSAFDDDELDAFSS